MIVRGSITFDCSCPFEERQEPFGQLKTKMPKCIFRGTITGINQDLTNQRIIAKYISNLNSDQLDVAFTSKHNYKIKDVSGKTYEYVIESTKLYENEKSIPMTEQFRTYKYILHIDGFVAAWRLARELNSGCVILKVRSDWIEHFYDGLKEYVHYVPIKENLSDLIEKILWCEANQEICEQIVQNALEFAKKFINLDKTLEYLHKKNNSNEPVASELITSELVTSETEYELIELMSKELDINIIKKPIEENKYIAPMLNYFSPSVLDTVHQIINCELQIKNDVFNFPDSFHYFDASEIKELDAALLLNNIHKKFNEMFIAIPTFTHFFFRMNVFLRNIIESQLFCIAIIPFEDLNIFLLDFDTENKKSVKVKRNQILLLNPYAKYSLVQNDLKCYMTFVKN